MVRVKLLLIFIWMAVPFHVQKASYMEILSSKYFTKFPGHYLAVSSTDKQRKFVIDNYAVYKFYLKHNRPNLYYQDFLTESLEKGISFNPQDLKPYEQEFPSQLINIKNQIFKNYQSKGINFIIAKYLSKLGKGRFRNKVMDDDTLYGLIYIMSVNKYIASFSDYSGYYQFITVEEISKRIRQANRSE